MLKRTFLKVLRCVWCVRIVSTLAESHKTFTSSEPLRDANNAVKLGNLHEWFFGVVFRNPRY